jgi:hypothetical protein
VFAGELACEFRNGEVSQVLEHPTFDSRWEDSSRCRCAACAWTGTVRELSGFPHPDAGASLDLEALESDLAAGHCPPRLARPMRRLLESVYKMQVHVEVLESLERGYRHTRAGGPGDTVVL